ERDRGAVGRWWGRELCRVSPLSLARLRRTHALGPAAVAAGAGFRPSREPVSEGRLGAEGAARQVDAGSLGAQLGRGILSQRLGHGRSAAAAAALGLVPA